MYSRNKQRKDQQLLNLRQLSAKSVAQIGANDDHNRDKHLNRSSHSPPLQSSTDSMANRSPNQSSIQSNQSSKASIVSRSVNRINKRDITSNNESTFGSKPEPNSNLMLRSVNRSPTVRSHTLKSIGLQSRPTLSPNSRTNTSLPQSLTQSVTNCQNKQSLSQINKISDKCVKQRAIKTLNDNQNQSNLKSMSTTSTSTTTISETTISPEILFLVREQAKAIAKINVLQKKVDQLEQTVKCQSTLDTTVDSSSASKSMINNSNASKERIHVSDDSGGEYSRATTTSDDDELSLLLDQIARRSQQLQNSQPLNNRFNNMSISSSISGNNRELLPQTIQMRSKWHSYVNPTLQMSHSTQSPSREPPLEHKIFGKYSSSEVPVIGSQVLPTALSSTQPLPAPLQSSYCQSISALLFDPNVENVLKNLDDIIATEAIDSKFSNASTLSQTYQRSQTSSQHSCHSLYDTIGVNAGAGVSSGSLINQNSNTSSTASNWQQMERVKSYLKEKEERELSKQMRLNEEWLQTQLKAHDPKQGLKRNTFIDSLEPSFR